MREWRPRFPSFVRCAGITRLNPTLKVVLPFPLRYDELTDSVFYHAGMQQPSLQANARPDEAPTPIACPICLDHAVIQMDGVRLSVTINGVCLPHTRCFGVPVRQLARVYDSFTRSFRDVRSDTKRSRPTLKSSFEQKSAFAARGFSDLRLKSTPILPM